MGPWAGGPLALATGHDVLVRKHGPSHAESMARLNWAGLNYDPE